MTSVPHIIQLSAKSYYVSLENYVEKSPLPHQFHIEFKSDEVSFSLSMVPTVQLSPSTV